MPVPRPENLQPPKTKEEARKRGRNGGIKSGIAKRQKKLMSQVYIKAMAERYKVNLNGETKDIDWDEFLTIVIRDIMMKKDSCSVSLMKEIREATEGSNIKITSELPQVVLSPKKNDEP